jgi:hypothetical protein
MFEARYEIQSNISTSIFSNIYPTVIDSAIKHDVVFQLTS